MTSNLLHAVERLRINVNLHQLDQGECIDNTLIQWRPRKRLTRDTHFRKKELEKDFLTPQTSFDAKWLDKIQQYVVHARKHEA